MKYTNLDFILIISKFNIKYNGLVEIKESATEDNHNEEKKGGQESHVK